MRAEGRLAFTEMRVAMFRWREELGGTILLRRVHCGRREEHHQVPVNPIRGTKMTRTSLFVLCLLVAGLASSGNRAHGCYPSGYPCYPVYYPCWCYPVHCYPVYYCAPYCSTAQPDETPITPKRPKPEEGAKPAKLELRNKSYSEYFVLIYLRHPDCVYRLYAKQRVKGGGSAAAPGDYYVGDDLIFETWSRGTADSRWHCRGNWGATLKGPQNVYTVNTGDIAYPKKEGGDEEAVSDEGRAKVIVSLPAEAKLKIEGQLMKSTGAERTFVTPKLAKGQKHSWTLEVELMQEGKPVTLTKKVNLTAGATERVTLTMPVTIEKAMLTSK